MVAALPWLGLGSQVEVALHSLSTFISPRTNRSPCRRLDEPRWSHHVRVFFSLLISSRSFGFWSTRRALSRDRSSDAENEKKLIASAPQCPFLRPSQRRFIDAKERLSKHASSRNRVPPLLSAHRCTSDFPLNSLIFLCAQAAREKKVPFPNVCFRRLRVHIALEVLAVTT